MRHVRVDMSRGACLCPDFDEAFHEFEDDLYWVWRVCFGIAHQRSFQDTVVFR